MTPSPLPSSTGAPTRPRRSLIVPATLALLLCAVVLAFAAAYALHGRQEEHEFIGELRELAASTRYEPLVGLDLGVSDDKQEILVTEAPDIDVIRAGLNQAPAAPEDIEPPPPGMLLICDFDKDGVTDREFSCPVGSWISDPTDPTIKFVEAYDPVYRFGDKGYCLKLWYDIESPNPAYGGLWVQFKPSATQTTLDLSGYRFLTIMVRGSSSSAGATTRFKIEMKNDGEVSSTILEGVTARWQKFEIPLERFEKITDWTRMKEMTVVIDGDVATKREGLLYFDEIGFLR